MQQSSHLSYNECLFCGQQQATGLAIMMGQALMAKHANNQSDSLIAYIDVIMKLQQPCNAFEAWAAYQYKESQIDDEKQQFLKRQYAKEEFGGKITMLTQYYKFHADVPRVIEPRIQKILGKYYDKKRQIDYKKIKRVLKEEQGLSISSVQESESSMNGDSEVERKSRYSTLLNALEDTKVNEDNMMSDSNLLKDMCKVIQKALPSKKHENIQFEVKQSFNQGRYFEQFLKKQEGRFKPKLKDRYKEAEQRHMSRRLNLQELLRKRGKKEVQKSRERDTNTRDSRQAKKKDKDKFIYNTNIKIEIKNAMFYSHGQQQHPPFQVSNVQYDSASKNQSKFRKKNLINQVNYINHQQSNKKLVSEIYKSSQNDMKRRLLNSASKQRVTTKQSMNRSQSKRKNSLSRQSTKQLKKGVPGSVSARKIVYANNEWTITNSNSNSKGPSRSTSASNLKRRSNSTNAVTLNHVPLSVATLSRKNDKIFEKRPIESISKYGSSDMNYGRGSSAAMHVLDRQKRAVSIKELLNRKLSIKKQ